MLARRVTTRYLDWRHLETRTDAWASYGALALALGTCLALFAVGPF